MATARSTALATLGTARATARAGTVNGTASLSTNPDGVFSLVGTTAYSLASGESTTIEVAECRFPRRGAAATLMFT